MEADWSTATFTMNWQLGRVGHPVTFAAGEPICMIVPQRRGELEAFRPEIRALESDVETHAGYQAWRASRLEFNADDAKQDATPVNRPEWQRHYFRGVDLRGKASSEHQTRLHLRVFEDSEDQERRHVG